MAEKTRIAVVGAGGMANHVHYPSWAEMDDVEVAGICDLDAERLNSTADRYGIEGRYADYKKMLEDTAPDGVYVIMPPHQLFDIVVHCLSLGLHVCIEKPPAVTTHQVQMLAQRAEANHCKTMVLFNRRFMPLLCQAKATVEERGEIIQCVATFYKNQIVDNAYYGGVIDILRCDAIHAVDTLRFMGGDVVAVASVIGSYHQNEPCAFNAVMEFESGATGVLLTNWSVGGRVHTFEMHAKGISAYVDGNSDARIFADNVDTPEVTTAIEAAGSDDFHRYYGFYDENRHFINCLRNDELPLTHFEDAVRTMELIDAIYAAGL